MKLSAAKNIVVSALNPKKTGVMARKVLVRLTGRHGSMDAAQNQAWLAREQITPEAWLAEQDPALWAEAEARAADYLLDVKRVEGQYPPEIHGPGGAYAMLYFLVRRARPEYVVETGVSLGCSSHAILQAMEDNSTGTLHSSEFPYFRIENAERYIGLTVPERLRGRWKLYLDGDAKNLPAILAQIPRVDFFHYDSDKSFEGRALAWRLIRDKMTKDGLYLMDDIQDNAYFHDLIRAENLAGRTRIINYHGKYIGVIDGF